MFSQFKSVLSFSFLLLLLGLSFSKSYAAPQKSLIQKITPQLTVPFKFKDINNRDINLTDYKGQWVLVNFWAPWCPICMTEIPTLNELNSFDNIIVLGMAMDYGPDQSVVVNKINSTNMNYTAHILGGSRRDPDSPYRQVGPVDFFPTSYLYSPTGEIVMFIPGQIRKNKIADFIQKYQTKIVKK
ncbi:MAG TPA: TlpA disulfide reductase family protein [Pseudobdellovibrionaceae bacterium]|nr:TlpA disulfide reductase family protein [Pseudobdellovibrionaceae bacterium]